VYVVNQAALLLQAIADIGVGGPFHTPKIALYTNDVSPARGMILADFTIADFAGLTNVRDVTLGAPFINDLQQAQANGDLMSWLTLTLPVDPVTAYGYVLVNSAGTAWLLAERFAEPLVFTRAGQSESLVPRLIWDC